MHTPLIVLLGVLFHGPTAPEIFPTSESDVRVWEEQSWSETGLPGIVEPARQVELSFPEERVVQQFRVKEGAQVQAGEILVVMDNREARQAVLGAEAAAERTAVIRRAELELNLADQLLQRLQRLDPGARSARELEEAQARRDQAAASLDLAREEKVQAERRLELERARLESLNVRAPFAGQIVRVDAVSGQTMNRAETLLEMANMERLQCELYLPLQWFGQLEIGGEYSLLAGAPVNRRLNAKLISHSPLIDPATQTFRCVLEIDNHDRQLPAGFSVFFEGP